MRDGHCFGGWNISCEDLIGIPPDVVLEANKVEEALVEADIHNK
jgi:hypothetical protein